MIPNMYKNLTLTIDMNFTSYSYLNSNTENFPIKLYISFNLDI